MVENLQEKIIKEEVMPSDQNEDKAEKKQAAIQCDLLLRQVVNDELTLMIQEESKEGKPGDRQDAASLEGEPKLTLGSDKLGQESPSERQGVEQEKESAEDFFTRDIETPLVRVSTNLQKNPIEDDSGFGPLPKDLASKSQNADEMQFASNLGAVGAVKQFQTEEPCGTEQASGNEEESKSENGEKLLFSKTLPLKQVKFQVADSDEGGSAGGFAVSSARTQSAAIA